MCLLLTGTGASIQSLYANATILADVYASNSDGVGAMFVEDGRLHIRKALPKSAEDAAKFIAELPSDDRMVAVHWRMRTHGDINFDNCHPYEVMPGTWLMHNGILHTGNAADESRSDTWHFIQDYLKDMSPDVLHNPNVVHMIGDFIRSNRFAIMSADGRLSVVNKKQGIEHDGIWFSNTYAWSPELFIPTYRSKSTSYYTGGRYSSKSLGGYDDLDTWGSRHSTAWGTPSGHKEEAPSRFLSGSQGSLTPVGQGAVNHVPLLQEHKDEFCEEVMESLEELDIAKLEELFREDFDLARTFILENYVIYQCELDSRLSDSMRQIVEAWETYDDAELAAAARTCTYRMVAHALLYCCDFIYQEGTTPTLPTRTAIPVDEDETDFDDVPSINYTN